MHVMSFFFFGSAHFHICVCVGQFEAQWIACQHKYHAFFCFLLWWNFPRRSVCGCLQATNSTAAACTHSILTLSRTLMYVHVYILGDCQQVKGKKGIFFHSFSSSFSSTWLPHIHSSILVSNWIALNGWVVSVSP